VADAPDPLGKRALFWAPAERHEAGPRRPEKPEKRVLPGRHALFSAVGNVAPTEIPKKNARPRPQLGATAPVRAVRPPRAQAARPPRARTPVTKVATPPTESGDRGPISLSCSKCGTHTDVDILKYLMLHLPWWLWRPGRGYTSLMKCPACGKRAWVSASWAPRPK
jgi:rRNA maturation protein Nop10